MSSFLHSLTASSWQEPPSRDQSGSLDESLLIRDNSLTSSIIKSSDKVSEEVQLCDEPTNSGLAVTSSVSTDWSPLQLSSYNLTKPPLLKPKPSLRTETLERHPVRPLLRTFTSGRCSAEPLDSYKLTNNKTRTRSQMDAGLMVTPLPTSLSELDLRYYSTSKGIIHDITLIDQLFKAQNFICTTDWLTSKYGHRVIKISIQMFQKYRSRSSSQLVGPNRIWSRCRAYSSTIKTRLSFAWWWNRECAGWINQWQ